GGSGVGGGDGGGSGFGGACVGGAGVGGSVTGGAGVAGVAGVACSDGSGNVGPLRRPDSNIMVTGAGGGSSSGCSSRRIVTSRNTPITTCSSSDRANAWRRRDRRYRSRRLARTLIRCKP